MCSPCLVVFCQTMYNFPPSRVIDLKALLGWFSTQDIPHALTRLHPMSKNELTWFLDSFTILWLFTVENKYYSATVARLIPKCIYLSAYGSDCKVHSYHVQYTGTVLMQTPLGPRNVSKETSFLIWWKRVC